MGAFEAHTVITWTPLVIYKVKACTWRIEISLVGGFTHVWILKSLLCRAAAEPRKLDPGDAFALTIM